MNYLLYLEDTEAIPAVKILLDSDTAPIGFTDSTDICNIHKYSKMGGFDYLGARSKLKDLFYSKSWDDCTNEEKQIVIDYSIYMDEDNVTASNEKITYLMSSNGLTLQQSIEYLETAFANDHLQLAEACNNRASSVALYEIIAKYLSNDDALDFKNTVRQILADYKEDALIGTQYSTTTTESGIVDYFKGQVGSDYETNNLTSKEYEIKNGHEITDLVTDLSNLFSDNYIKDY